MSVSLFCSDSGFSAVVLEDTNTIGAFSPAVKFCPVCGMSVEWGWFGLSHVATNTVTGERIWSPNDWLVVSA